MHTDASAGGRDERRESGDEKTEEQRIVLLSQSDEAEVLSDPAQMWVLSVRWSGYKRAGREDGPMLILCFASTLNSAQTTAAYEYGTSTFWKFPTQ